MKTAISLNDELFIAADTKAKELGVSRSQFFAVAAERYLQELESETITEAYNRVYGPLGGQDPETAEFIREAARRTMERSEW